MCLSPVRGNNSYVEARPESEKLKWICRNCWGAIYQQSLPSIFTKIETDLSQHLESIQTTTTMAQATISVPWIVSETAATACDNCKSTVYQELFVLHGSGSDMCHRF